MKKIILLGITTLFALQLSAQTKVNSQITEVTVFLNGAQVTEEGTIALQKGENVLVFSELAQNIDPNSIQASAPDIVLINSVSHEINYMRPQVLSPRVQGLQDSLKLVQAEAEILNNEKTVLTYENNLLLANQKLEGSKNGITAEELRKISDFFRTRLHDIQEKLLKNTRAITKNNELRSKLQLQLNELNGNQKAPSNDIVVKVRADYARTVKVGIRYLVMDAGWVPRYDLRASNTTDPIRLDYRADVWQRTGVEWNDIKLTLSSGDPQLGGTKPELTQWSLWFGSPSSYRTRSYSGFEDREQNSEGKSYQWSDSGGYAGNLAGFTNMRNALTNTEFAIGPVQNVPTDGKMQQVSIQTQTLPATFQHYAIPKLDKDAFLVARVTEWESLNLLPGDVSIFFEGTYVTKAYLDPSITNDTLDFSLGRDKKVIIERNLLKDYNSKKDIGTNKERTFGYEFVVRNTKNTPIRIVIQDQLPISSDELISIKEIELSDAKKDESTGILTYDLSLNPAETKKFRLVYSVKYPKKKTISGL